MTLLIILIIIIILCLKYFKPYLDIYKDYRGNLHVLLWYKINNKRSYLIIIGGL